MDQSAAPLLYEQAYERILEALFDKRVVTGDRITQGKLARITGMPVGPLRDALKTLSADGVVKIHSRSGVEVVQPSTDLTRATFQFRAFIEKPAARSFAQSAAPSQIEDLIAQHLRFDAGLVSTDPNMDVADQLNDMEMSFHLALTASLRNELIDSAYRRLQLSSRIVKFIGEVYPHAARVSIGEHLEVLEACQKRDPDMAEAAIARHLTNALARNLGMP